MKQGKFLEVKDIKKIKGKFDEEQVVAAFCDNEIIALVRSFFGSEELRKKEGYVLKPERVI